MPVLVLPAGGVQVGSWVPRSCTRGADRAAHARIPPCQPPTVPPCRPSVPSGPPARPSPSRPPVLAVPRSSWLSRGHPGCPRRSQSPRAPYGSTGPTRAVQPVHRERVREDVPGGGGVSWEDLLVREGVLRDRPPVHCWPAGPSPCVYWPAGPTSPQCTMARWPPSLPPVCTGPLPHTAGPVQPRGPYSLGGPFSLLRWPSWASKYVVGAGSWVPKYMGGSPGSPSTRGGEAWVRGGEGASQVLRGGGGGLLSTTGGGGGRVLSTPGGGGRAIVTPGGEVAL